MKTRGKSMTISKGSKRRERDGRWCEVTVELREGTRGPVLSITGAEGAVISQRAARREARDFWEAFFDDNPDELHAMNARCGTRYRSPKSAARFVLETDGELHGLDVHDESGNKVYTTESCGQIRESIDEWFPEVVLFFPWHLNDMHAGCEHQDARGETYDSHPGAVCPECGWKLGHGWHHRPLPPEVIEWARDFGKEAKAA
jgi:hypothetical protein